MANEPFSVFIVGGASGVGKTTLLSTVSGLDKVNTGTLFKDRMALTKRDDVRKSEWADFEGGVTDDLAAACSGALMKDGRVVIDTHFAAKLHGTYRVGLRQDLIFDLATRLLRAADESGRLLRVRVLLVNCDAQALLQRRRKDKRRERDLVPADCLNAVRENLTCSRRYLFECRRAAAGLNHQSAPTVDYAVVQNDDLEAASSRINILLQGD